MKQVEFTSDGWKLKGNIFYPKVLKEKNPAILFIHGWTSKKARSYRYAEELAKLGYISFLFDMRGHGDSEGDIDSFTIKEFLDDVLTAYDYLLGIEGVDKENISAIGSSFGGFLIALLSEKRPIKNLAMRVPADYPNEDFNKIKTTSSHEGEAIIVWRRKIKKPSNTFALSALKDFDGKVLIIEAELDDTIPHETVINYVNAVSDRNKVKHVLMKNATHSITDGPFKNEVTRILVDWFKTVSST